MGSKELTNWMGFVSLQDDEYRSKVEKEVAEEKQKDYTEEDLAEQMRNMFLGLKNNGDNGRD